MPDTDEARAAIREAYEAHRNVMGGMSTALMMLEIAAGLDRPDPLLNDPPLPYDLDDPVWLADAYSALGRALQDCAELAEKVRTARLKAAVLVDAQQEAGLADSARCGTLMLHPDETTAPCLLAKSHRRDGRAHQDEHGHTAPLLVSQSTIDEVDTDTTTERCSSGLRDPRHDWQLDPQHRGEGNCCVRCGATEAELEFRATGNG